MQHYDVIVVGGGHAGIEAAAAAARIGARVALLTSDPAVIGAMSCNPAIGGLAKGQLVREIDALGGLMAQAADATGIHFRLLGRSKGPAMWSPRSQCDRHAYAAYMHAELTREPGIEIVAGEVVAVLVDATRRVRGVGCGDGRELLAPAVVLTTGTFLDALMHQGRETIPGGRMGEHAAVALSASLRTLGLPLHRLKTGTPPRLRAASIDYACCTEQPGDPDPRPFAFTGGAAVHNQVLCWSCATTSAAHELIRANLDRAPLYNGQIVSTGPRYCPSIEDKVVRFADREQHHLFLEPEGLGTDAIYVNGLATSLPVDVQTALLAEIPALRCAEVLRYGYAVEYDAVRTEAIDHRLSVPAVPGLYLAGQINGTSGYEEAGIQGLVAGANAALALDGRDPLILTRADAYGGVLIDDLVVCAPDEPYRMFTSRAEHRLHLRADNADRRLASLAARAGLIDAARARAVAAKAERIAAVVAAVEPALAARIAGSGLDLAATRALVPELAGLPAELAEGAWIELRYAGYLERQRARIERMQRQRDVRLPDDLDYAAVPALSAEGRRCLEQRRPGTLGEAERLGGVKQADVENLWAYLQRRTNPRGAATVSNTRAPRCRWQRRNALGADASR
ncbi:MAG: tRNA uridine-5-carboxymethylaminomethyl(34) synthesis enzyme MnmG [Planctomycetota bacterium]